MSYSYVEAIADTVCQECPLRNLCESDWSNARRDPTELAFTITSIREVINVGQLTVQAALLETHEETIGLGRPDDLIISADGKFEETFPANGYFARCYSRQEEGSCTDVPGSDLEIAILGLGRRSKTAILEELINSGTPDKIRDTADRIRVVIEEWVQEGVFTEAETRNALIGEDTALINFVIEWLKRNSEADEV